MAGTPASPPPPPPLLPPPANPDLPVAMREAGWVPMYYFAAVRQSDLAYAAQLFVAVTAAIDMNYARVQDQLAALGARVNEAFQDRDERTKIALHSRDEAITSASRALEKRLELLNEFRAQSIDSQAKFAIREHVDGMLGDLSRQVGAAVPREAYDARLAGLDKIVGDLSARLTRYEGAHSGSTSMIATILAIAGFIVTAATLIVAIYLMRGGGGPALP